MNNLNELLNMAKEEIHKNPGLLKEVEKLMQNPSTRKQLMSLMNNSNSKNPENDLPDINTLNRQQRRKLE